MALEKLKQILCDEFDIDEGDITPDVVFRDDFGLDELDVIDLVMSIEDEFGMELSDESLENIETIGDLVKFIEEN